jgi:micrococcal nuclease
MVVFAGNDTENENYKTEQLEQKIESLEKQLEERQQKELAENIEAIETIENNNKNQEIKKLKEEIVEEEFKVVNVVDGDTIKLENGDVVRYIGIDAPETVHPSKPVQCFGKEASDKNEELVEGKEVRLVKDISETDKYGRLLRYVYIDDIFVNDYLVRNGFANSSSYPPDVKYQDQFKQAEEEARNNKRGLWADDACKVDQKPTASPIPIDPPTTSSSTSSYTCDCSKTCAQMSSCAEAQYQLNVCGCSRRDGDGDGIACDSDCQ